MPIVIAQFVNPPTYNVVGASYDNKSYDYNPPNTNSFDLFFKPDGTKLYLIDGNNGSAKVTQHTLSTAWDISSASYDSVSLSLQALEPNAAGMFIKPDGTELYITGQFNDVVRQFTMTAWDLSTATLTAGFYVGTQDSSMGCVYIRPDGTKMYTYGNSGDTLYQYTLSTPWLVSSATYNTSKAFPDTGALYGVNFRDDGLAMYSSTNSTDLITQYTLSSAWNISTIVAAGTFNTNAPANGPAGIRWKADGTKFYTATPGNDIAYQFSVTG